MGCAMVAFMSGKLKKEYDACVADCLEPCGEHLTPQIATTYSTFPGMGQERELANGLLSRLGVRYGLSTQTEALEWSRDLLMLDVYAESNAYVVRELVEKMSIFTFIGSVGGILGLWLGASLITILQCAYFAFSFAVQPALKRRMKKKRIVSSPAFSETNTLEIPPTPEYACDVPRDSIYGL